MYCIVLYTIMQCFPLIYGSDYPSSRIVGGTPVTDNGDYLYQVSIYKNNHHSCGGSIIGPTKILTAGHCFKYQNKGIFKIYAGITQLNQTEDPEIQPFKIKTYSIHPEFHERTLVNDIAIITLETPINLDETTNIIRLRSERVELNEKLTVSGWGYTSKRSNASNSLQWLKVRNLKIHQCKIDLKRAKRGSKHTVNHSNLCSTSIAGEGACKGDSGGPLVDQQYRQVGIVSWGKPCARGVPDVYTSIAYHYEWITNELRV